MKITEEDKKVDGFYNTDNKKIINEICNIEFINVRDFIYDQQEGSYLSIKILDGAYKGEIISIPVYKAHPNVTTRNISKHIFKNLDSALGLIIEDTNDYIGKRINAHVKTNKKDDKVYYSIDKIKPSTYYNDYCDDDIPKGNDMLSDDDIPF